MKNTMSKNVDLGIPLVQCESYKGSAWAKVNMDYFTKDNILQLSNIIKELTALGFHYNGTTHTLGYYESVEDISLEFYNPSFKKPNHQ